MSPHTHTATICLPEKTMLGNGSLDCTDYNALDSVCIYQCDEGYLMDRPVLNTSQCLEDGDDDSYALWTELDEPSCVRKCARSPCFWKK